MQHSTRECSESGPTELVVRNALEGDLVTLRGPATLAFTAATVPDIDQDGHPGGPGDCPVCHAPGVTGTGFIPPLKTEFLVPRNLRGTRNLIVHPPAPMNRPPPPDGRNAVSLELARGVKAPVFRCQSARNALHFSIATVALLIPDDLLCLFG
jgi:hypothetical protein